MVKINLFFNLFVLNAKNRVMYCKYDALLGILNQLLSFYNYFFFFFGGGGWRRDISLNKDLGLPLIIK